LQPLLHASEFDTNVIIAAVVMWSELHFIFREDQTSAKAIYFKIKPIFVLEKIAANLSATEISRKILSF
jgi:hypothetical protein